MQNHFSGKAGWPLELFKNVLFILEFLLNFFWNSVRSLNRIFSATKYLFEALECQILSTKNKSISCEAETNFGNLQRLSVFIVVSYKFALKSVKKPKWNLLSLWIFVEVFRMRVLLINRKASLMESKTNHETLQKLFPYIAVAYKFVQS